MGDFRFDPHRVRQVGLPTTAHAKALKLLWERERRPEDLERLFGPSVVKYLEREGYVTLAEGAYYLAVPGVRALLQCGYPPERAT